MTGPLRLEADMAVPPEGVADFTTLIARAKDATEGFDGSVDPAGAARLTLDATDAAAIVLAIERIGPHLAGIDGIATLSSIGASAALPHRLRARLATLAPLHGLS